MKIVLNTNILLQVLLIPAGFDPSGMLFLMSSLNYMLLARRGETPCVARL